MSLPTPSWFERVAFASDVCSLAKAAPDGVFPFGGGRELGHAGIVSCALSFLRSCNLGNGLLAFFPCVIHSASLHEVTLEPLALIELCLFPLKPVIVDTCAAERGAICRNYDR